MVDGVVGRGGVCEVSVLFAGGTLVDTASSWEPFELAVMREEAMFGLKGENLNKNNSAINFTSFVTLRTCGDCR